MTPFLPPPEYDFAPNVPVIEHALSTDEIIAICGPYMGCTWKVPRKDRCEIWIIKAGSVLTNQNGTFVISKYVEDGQRRHERAHCNGWRHD